MPTSAHSYADPALTTVFDRVTPALPAGVQVDVQPSVVDQLVLSNTTASLLEVLGRDGQPFLRISTAGVLADFSSPDWYATATPEGATGPSGARPRWVQVSRGSAWSEFDLRLRPQLDVAAAIRKAGADRILTGWTIPLRYGGRALSATGHIEFRPVRGGLVVAVTRSPLTATPLQGELPGIFLRVDAEPVEVEGKDGLPFLRFARGVVMANTASLSWREDRAARGLEAPERGWARVATGPTFSWLDSRLRYPRDQPPPPLVGHQSVVQRWAVPLRVGGQRSSIEGTVRWVPRTLAVQQLQSPAQRGSGQPPVLVALLVAAAVALAMVRPLLVLRRRRTTG